MAILIEGMEMPKTCELCPLVDRTVAFHFLSFKCKVTKKFRPDSCFTRPDWCPLIEVPEPHGRLILADELIEFIENRYKITWKDDYEGGIKDACVDILEKISTMPRYSTSESKERPVFLPQYELTPRSEEGKT